MLTRDKKQKKNIHIVCFCHPTKIFLAPSAWSQLRIQVQLIYLTELRSQGRSLFFCVAGWGSRFQGVLGDRSPPAGLRGASPVGVWGPRPQKKNLNFIFMKRTKAVHRICAVNSHALAYFLFVWCILKEISAFWHHVDVFLQTFCWLICRVQAVCAQWQQKAQLSQRGRAMPRVVEYFR